MAARGVNKVILVGHLGQDPEVRYMPNGGAVASLTLATSETWRDKQTGEMRENTEWHRVVMFGKLAEVAGEYRGDWLPQQERCCTNYQPGRCSMFKKPGRLDNPQCRGGKKCIR